MLRYLKKELNKAMGESEGQKKKGTVKNSKNKVTIVLVRKYKVMWTGTQAWASDYYWRELWSKNVMMPQDNRSQQSSLSLNTEINTRQILGWLPVIRPSSLLRQYQHRPGASMMHS